MVAREDLLALLPRGLLHREGIFNLLFLLAFVVGILVLLVTSGLGLTERRREIGILKATGWQTDEVLLRSLAESFCLSLAGPAWPCCWPGCGCGSSTATASLASSWPARRGTGLPGAVSADPCPCPARLRAVLRRRADRDAVFYLAGGNGGPPRSDEVRPMLFETRRWPRFTARGRGPRCAAWTAFLWESSAAASRC